MTSVCCVLPRPGRPFASRRYVARETRCSAAETFGNAAITPSEISSSVGLMGSPSKHVPDIRGARRISEYRVLQILCTPALATREREDIDHLVRVRADQVRAENALRAILDEQLEAVGRLGNPARP